MKIQAITNFKCIVEELPKLIDISGYKNEYIARKLEMKPQFFSSKKIKNNFDLVQVEKILTIIFNEDVEDYLLLLEMRNRKNDETISFEDYKKEIAGWK